MKIDNVSIVERSYRVHGTKGYASKTRVYVHPKGESILENLVNRRSRPHNVWRPLVLKELKDAGIHVQSLTWSQKAGCTCGCSPGFIVNTFDGPVRLDDYTPIDIYIDVKE